MYDCHTDWMNNIMEIQVLNTKYFLIRFCSICMNLVVLKLIPLCLFWFPYVCWLFSDLIFRCHQLLDQILCRYKAPSPLLRNQNFRQWLVLPDHELLTSVRGIVKFVVTVWYHIPCTMNDQSCIKKSRSKWPWNHIQLFDKIALHYLSVA